MSLSLAGLRAVSYSGSNQNQLFFSYTQQTSQDNQRLSLTPTTPKKEENTDYLGEKAESENTDNLLFQNKH